MCVASLWLGEVTISPIAWDMVSYIYLKTFARDYFSGGILYDPPPKFAVKTAKTRHPRPEIGRVPWFNHFLFLDPGSGDENNKEQ